MLTDGRPPHGPDPSVCPSRGNGVSGSVSDPWYERMAWDEQVVLTEVDPGILRTDPSRDDPQVPSNCCFWSTTKLRSWPGPEALLNERRPGQTLQGDWGLCRRRTYAPGLREKAQHWEQPGVPLLCRPRLKGHAAKFSWNKLEQRASFSPATGGGGAFVSLDRIPKFWRAMRP